MATFCPKWRKFLNLFFAPSSAQVAPMKKLLYIKVVTLIPSYADVKAQWAYFKGADSMRVHRFCTFYFFGSLYLEIPPSDFTW